MSDSKKSLDEVIKKIAKKRVEYNFEQRKLSWIESVRRLYTQIEGWLGEFIRAGDVNLIPVDVTIREQHIGEYKAPALDIHIGEELIEMRPIGTLIVAARGRVDIVYGNRKAKLLLLGINEEPTVQVYVGEEQIRKSEERRKTQRNEEPAELVWKVSITGNSKNLQVLTKDLFGEILDQLLA